MIKRLFNSTSTLSAPAQWLIDWIRPNDADSGVSVTIGSTLSYPPVWYAISKISGHVGLLPLNLHRKLDRGAEHASTHPAYRLLRTRPNLFQTASSFKETMMMHALLCGNGRAAIVRQNGNPVELLPLLPNCTYTCLVDGEKWHVVKCSDDDRCVNVPGGPSKYRDGKWYKIPDRDVLHIPGLGYDGVAGLSLVNVARDTFGLGLAAIKAGARSFKNGSKPGVIIHAPPGTLRDDQSAKEFIDNFNSYHTGIDNAGRAALLREGMTLSTIQMSAEDAQWVEQRQFERQEVSLLFGLESMPGDDNSVSYNSLEQKNQAYLTNCLSKWLVKWEQECDYKLLNDRVQRTHFFKFNTAALLKPDFKSTMESLSTAITARIMSPNEAREKLDMNPYDGGDEFANPAITPGSPGQTDDEGEEMAEDDEQMTVDDANRRAVVSRLRHLLGVAANNTKDAAKEQERFLKWCDRYFDENGKWTHTFGKAVAEFGSGRFDPIAFCEKLRVELLEVSGTVTQEGLPAAVAEVVSAWPDLAEQLACEILYGEACNA